MIAGTDWVIVRASLHEDLAKKLLKQTKTELGREETGTLGMLLASTQKQMESSAQAHQELARKIRVELELPLDNFILEQKDKRKLVCNGGGGSVRVILHNNDSSWIYIVSDQC